ncbi:MAG: hypothetical protein ABR529_14135 [Actinomycetota bacterium]
MVVTSSQVWGRGPDLWSRAGRTSFTGAGDDPMVGRGEDDIFHGGAGDDVMRGGSDGSDGDIVSYAFVERGWLPIWGRAKT